MHRLRLGPAAGRAVVTPRQNKFISAPAHHELTTPGGSGHGSRRPFSTTAVAGTNRSHFSRRRARAIEDRGTGRRRGPMKIGRSSRPPREVIMPPAGAEGWNRGADTDAMQERLASLAMPASASSSWIAPGEQAFLPSSAYRRR